NASAINVAHMLFAHSDAAWAEKTGTTWFSTHPSLEERVRELDPRITSIKFRTLVSDERRKIAQRALPPAEATPAADSAAPLASASQAPPPSTDAGFDAMGLAPAQPVISATATAPLPVLPAAVPSIPAVAAIPAAPAAGLALAETMPSGIRMVG